MRVTIKTTLLVDGQPVKEVVAYDNTAFPSGARLKQTSNVYLNGTRVKQSTTIDQVITAPAPLPPPTPTPTPSSWSVAHWLFGFSP